MIIVIIFILQQEWLLLHVTFSAPVEVNSVIIIDSEEEEDIKPLKLKVIDKTKSPVK